MAKKGATAKAKAALNVSGTLQSRPSSVAMSAGPHKLTNRDHVGEFKLFQLSCVAEP